MSPSSAINNDKCFSCRPDLDARGVSSVTSRARSGLGYRTASPPELYPHVASTNPTTQPATALASPSPRPRRFPSSLGLAYYGSFKPLLAQPSGHPFRVIISLLKLF